MRGFDDCVITVGPDTTTLRAHGEDVKECYFYIDATPTASYLKMLYKYPQAEFPYADLIAVNAARGKSDPEYERIPLDWPDLLDRSWQVTDILGQNVFERDGGELASPGLFVDLGPWQFHLLALQ